MGDERAGARDRRRTRQVLAGGVAALVCLVSACGSEGADPAATSHSSSVSSSGSSSSSSGQADLRGWFIDSDDLPGNWRSSEPPGPGFRQQVCGVDIEPTPPDGGDRARFSQGGLGPFLAQYVRMHSSAQTPGQVLSDLREALPGCTRYTTRDGGGDGPRVTFRVEQLEVDGLPEDAVAWRQTSTEGAKVTTDMVLLAKGEALVAFVSYALRQDPDPRVLADAVSAFGRKDLP